MKQKQDIDPYKSLLKADKYYPSLSIITSFHFTINQKKEIEGHFKHIVNKAKEILVDKCSEELIEIIENKLVDIVKNIDYKKNNTSIAIFISPIYSKVYYIELALEDRIVVGDSFEIRDLIYSINNLHKYLLISLSSKKAFIYLGNTESLLRMKKIDASDIAEMNNDMPEKVANFTDASKIKENLLDKFLHYIDKQLNPILQQYNLPIFIMGTIKTNGHFASISHHSKSIVQYIHGNYLEKTETELLDIVTPYVVKWKKIKNRLVLEKIEYAMGQKKVSFGIKNVWRCATEKNGRHLIVEKNFVYPARHGSKENEIFEKDLIINNQLYIYDAVDDIIEKIISNGGTVEFIDQGLLSDYGKIVLLQYY